MQDFDSLTGLLLPENFNAACETALVTQRANHSFHGVLMVVNVDKLKFVENEEDFGTIIRRIDSELFGLF